MTDQPEAQFELRPLNLFVSEIAECSRVMACYLDLFVENHYQWTEEPTFDERFDVVGAQVFGDAWNARRVYRNPSAPQQEEVYYLSCECREHARRMARFIHAKYLEFRTQVEINYGGICPHHDCGAVRTFKYEISDGLGWRVTCTNCGREIACDDDVSGV